MPEAITKFAVNSTLGTSSFAPLDVIIKENTKINIQSAYASFSESAATVQTEYATLSESVDPNKTIVILNGYKNYENTQSVSFYWSNEQLVIRREGNGARMPKTTIHVWVITFGENLKVGV